MSKHLILTTAILGSLALSSPSFAKDKEAPPVAGVTDAQKALASFKRSFKSEDIDLRLDAIERLAKVNHPTVATYLLKLMKHKDPYVSAGAVEGLGNQYASAKKVGSKLAKLLDKYKPGSVDSSDDEAAREAKAEAKRVRSAVIALGKLDYRRALEELETLLRSDDDEIVVAVFWTFGQWGDEKTLDAMHKWYEVWPDEKGFSAISVSVDTGSAGNADQKAAQAKGKSMQAKANAWRKRPKCTQALRDAGKKITGYNFLRPDDLGSYLKSPKKYQDPEKVAERLDEAQRRAMWDEYQHIYNKSMALALEEVPGEDEGKRRSHAHFRHMEKMRKEMIEQRGLTLSELDVILAEGKKNRWPKPKS